ncbi:hypothetical protein SNEBB_002094 [Seison nebaliae]|nr:hypothetical protein SNEBB_002094 [Seison nebaliae]
MDKPKLKIWTMDELRKVKKFKEDNPQLTLDQMAAKLSVSLGRTVSTTRARLGQIDRHLDQMEMKMATPKPPIPDIFRNINSPSTTTGTAEVDSSHEEVLANESIEIPSFTETIADEVYQFKNDTILPTEDNIKTITVTKKTNDGSPNQPCKFNSIKFLSSLRPTANDVILGVRNNSKRRRTNSTNDYITNCKKCNIVKISTATQTDNSPATTPGIIFTQPQNPLSQNNNDDLMIIDPPEEYITVEMDTNDQTMRMAREYFGGKPFDGQQKLMAEPYPSDKEMVKLAREDTKKAANFIFNYDKKNKTKGAQPKSITTKSGNTINHLEEHQFKYLGVDIDQFGNIKQTTIAEFKELINKVDQTPLDGRTKFKIVEKYGLPKVLFRMANSDQTRAELRKINGAYRKFVRSTHRFRNDFPITGMHLAPNNGGVGATDIEESVARSIYKSSSKMLEDNSSKYFQKVVKAANINKRRDDNGKYLKVQDMADNMDLKTYHQEKLLNRLMKSQRVAESAKPFFQNKRANKWIKNDRLPTKVRNDFFKLRYNIMPTNSTTHFFNGGKKKCRGCGGPSENVKHLITKCPATKGLVMDRHNEIIRKLVALGQRQNGARIYQEKCFQTEDGIIKPDLIIVNGNTAKIMEIAVTMEDNEHSLEKRYQEKLNKYKKYNHIFQEQLRASNIIHEPIVVGALGDIHDKSAATMVRNFKTSRFTIQDISTMLLKKARNMVYLITHLRNN